jgi:hypothetical protein
MTTSLDQDVVMNERDISDLIQYKDFVSLSQSKFYGLDLSFMNNSTDTLPRWMIDNFNACLLELKSVKGYSIVTILSKLSEEYMDLTKIKRFIDIDVLWEIIDEVRDRYPGIKQEYPESMDNLDELFL